MSASSEMTRPALAAPAVSTTPLQRPKSTTARFDPYAFGRRVQERRADQNLARVELARKACIRYQRLYQIEAFGVRPRHDEAVSIAEALGTDFLELWDLAW